MTSLDRLRAARFDGPQALFTEAVRLLNERPALPDDLTDLVARLRNEKVFLAQDAADAIEALKAKVARLEKDVQACSDANHAQALCINFAASALGDCDAATIKGLPNKCSSMRERAERAEANAAKLAEALRPFAEALRGNYSHQSDDMLISMGHGADDLRWVLPLGDFRRAVAALAALEGGAA